LIDRLEDARDFRAKLDALVSVYPFNEYEYIISTLLGRDKLTLEEYTELREAYIDRNLYLYIFEISAPRGFGDRWALGHLKELVPALKRPSKQWDSNYSGEYDLWLAPGIRIEVKSSRAVDAESDEPLYAKALSSDSNRPFDMNFQQLKPYCCDVFLWIAVWRDKIRYWVLSSNEVENNRYYSAGQHRGSEGEGQLHLNQDNLVEFDPYAVSSIEIEIAIRQAYERQISGQK
ncbi:hypothetical protein HYR99_08230, partial [Candidatus Poribacteria bacterium]|nr:hypothetical protein [Candidatus Poribacteria bacterium]